MLVPLHLRERINKEGGRSPSGLPLFRCLWGGDRLTWAGGRWKKFDDNDNIIGEVIEERQVPKYPHAVERFIFEQWMPPEFYGTPEWWEEQFTQQIDGHTIHTLGPYPREGDYELLKVLETPRGHFVPLTHTIMDALIHTARINRTVSLRARLDFKHELDALRKKEMENKRQAILDDLAGPSWNTSPHIIVPDLNQTKGEIVSP